MADATTDTAMLGFRTRRWYQRRDVVFIIVVTAIVAVYYAYGYVTGPGRITAELHAALDADPKRMNIVITPEIRPRTVPHGCFPEIRFHAWHRRHGGNALPREARRRAAAIAALLD